MKRKIRVILPDLHPGQKRIEEALNKYRFVVCCFGRRAGKTTGGTVICAKWGLKWKEQTIWWVAPTRAISKISFRLFLKIVPPALIKNLNRSDLEVELLNGSRIAWKSADRPYTLLGEGLNFLVIDEAAEVKEDVWSEVLRPALSDKEGSALLMSRPHGANWFYEEYLKGLPDSRGVPKEPGYISLHLESRENPFFPKEEWEAAKRQLPKAIFDQEYRAIFTVGTSAVFGNIDDALVDFVQPAPGRRFMGVDPGRSRDYAAIVVLDLERNVVACKAWRGLSLHLLAEIVERMALEWDAEVIIDSHVIGQGLVDFLKIGPAGPRIVAYPVKDKSIRRSLIEDLALALDPAISNPHIKIPCGPNKDFSAHPDGESLAELYRELKDMDYRVSPSGEISYVPGVGGHDDLVIALALANYGWKKHFTSRIQVSTMPSSVAKGPKLDVVATRRVKERKYSRLRYGL